jgi:hypothetical protein
MRYLRRFSLSRFVLSGLSEGSITSYLGDSVSTGGAETLGYLTFMKELSTLSFERSQMLLV